MYLLNTTQTNNVYETVAATVLSWRGMTVILKKTSKWYQLIRWSAIMIAAFIFKKT